MWATWIPRRRSGESNSELNNLGFSCGPEDNLYGLRTRSALQLFQRKYQLEATGEINEETRARILEIHGR